MKRLILTLTLTAALGWAIDLKDLAAAASTPAEHAKVAKQYRAHAGQLEEKAQKHEAEARRLEAMPRPAIEHKWPAMGRQPWIEERKLAMQARRAANEARAIAEKHVWLTVETLAGQ